VYFIFRQNVEPTFIYFFLMALSVSGVFEDEGILSTTALPFLIVSW